METSPGSFLHDFGWVSFSSLRQIVDELADSSERKLPMSLVKSGVEEVPSEGVRLRPTCQNRVRGHNCFRAVACTSQSSRRAMRLEAEGQQEDGITKIERRSSQLRDRERES